VTGGRSIPSSQQVQPYLEKVYGKLARRSDLRLGLFEKDKLDATEYRPFCDLALAFYQELRRLPKSESSAILRTLYADASKYCDHPVGHRNPPTPARLAVKS